MRALFDSGTDAQRPSFISFYLKCKARNSLNVSSVVQNKVIATESNVDR